MNFRFDQFAFAILLSVGLALLLYEIRNELSAVRNELSAATSTVRNELSDRISTVRNELSVATSTVRNELSDRISTVRGELSAATSAIRGDLADLKKVLPSAPPEFYAFSDTHVKSPVPCLAKAPRSRAAVIVTAGQSNAANSGGGKQWALLQGRRPVAGHDQLRHQLRHADGRPADRVRGL